MMDVLDWIRGLVSLRYEKMLEKQHYVGKTTGKRGGAEIGGAGEEGRKTRGATLGRLLARRRRFALESETRSFAVTQDDLD